MKPLKIENYELFDLSQKNKRALETQLQVLRIYRYSTFINLIQIILKTLKKCKTLPLIFEMPNDLSCNS